jgi:putative FmdB family regulatory protein
VPLYEYHCPKCGRFELIQKFSDPPVSVCPTCGGEVQKMLSAPAIQFKGTGWYITDYARKGGGGKGEAKDGGAKETGASKTEGAASGGSDTKTSSGSGSSVSSTT